MGPSKQDARLFMAPFRMFQPVPRLVEAKGTQQQLDKTYKMENQMETTIEGLGFRAIYHAILVTAILTNHWGEGGSSQRIIP